MYENTKFLWLKWLEWKSGISQILQIPLGMAEMGNNSAKSGMVGMSAFDAVHRLGLKELSFPKPDRPWFLHPDPKNFMDFISGTETAELWQRNTACLFTTELTLYWKLKATTLLNTKHCVSKKCPTWYTVHIFARY